MDKIEQKIMNANYNLKGAFNCDTISSIKAQLRFVIYEYNGIISRIDKKLVDKELFEIGLSVHKEMTK